eukprot:COSAG02_NODE_56_length_43700_cov_33.650765_21_plen_179_part_00
MPLVSCTFAAELTQTFYRRTNNLHADCESRLIRRDETMNVNHDTIVKRDSNLGQPMGAPGDDIAYGVWCEGHAEAPQITTWKNVRSTLPSMPQLSLTPGIRALCPAPHTHSPYCENRWTYEPATSQLRAPPPPPPPPPPCNLETGQRPRGRGMRAENCLSQEGVHDHASVSLKKAYTM